MAEMNCSDPYDLIWLYQRRKVVIEVMGLV